MKQEEIISLIRKKRFVLFILLILLLIGLVFFCQYFFEKQNISLSKEVKTENLENDPTSFRFTQLRGTSEKKEEDKFEIMVNQMDYKKKIGQILLTSLDGEELTDYEFNLLKEGSVSGFLLFSKNIKDEEQVKKLTFEINKIATISGIVPIVAIDQEGGSVSRIDWIKKTSQSEIKTEKEAYEIGLERGKQLRDMGIWMNFSPVVECGENEIRNENEIDKSNNQFLFPASEDKREKNGIIRHDKLDLNSVSSLSREEKGDENEEVESFISQQKRGFESNCKELSYAMVDGYRKEGILGVSKHFPDGLVKTKEDPHLVLPKIDLNREELEFESYKYLIDKGIEGLMVTHLIYPKIDDEITSKSQFFIRDILRKELGFDYLVVIDDLSMKAVSDNYSLGEFVVASMKNEGDLFIVSNRENYEEVYEYLVGIEDEEFEEKLNESVGRILKLKERYKKKFII